MKEWLDRVRFSLSKAVQALDVSDEIRKENLYMLAPLFYSQEHHMNDERVLKTMCEEIDEQFKKDCSYDENSKYQYKFHFVSSYLHCYVVAGKIDEYKYDRIMEYVNDRINLFEQGYQID